MLRGLAGALLLAGAGCAGDSGRTELLFVDNRPVIYGLAGGMEASDSASPAVVVSHGMRLAARNVLEFELTPVQPGDPLVRVLDTPGRVIRTVGIVDVPENSFLGEVANAGWVAADEDGSVYFAPALRPELRRYDAQGRLAWKADWPIASMPPTARFTAVRGRALPVFTIVQHGIAVGPDDRVYVLAASDSTGRPDRVHVFTRAGELESTHVVEPGVAVYADRAGRLTTTARDSALARLGGRAGRAAFPEFALPTLTGDTLRLADYRGRVVVLNFWASWCAPCRREMPQLEQLARELAPSGVAVIGMNDDVHADDARAFVAEVGVTYPSVQGGGRLKSQFRYRGLPYTVVLDRELRVVHSIYGFGDDIGPLRERILAVAFQPHS